MLKRRKHNVRDILAAIAAGLIVLMTGIFVVRVKYPSFLSSVTPWTGGSTQAPFDDLIASASETSVVLSLARSSPEARMPQLELIAGEPRVSLERSRARYLLASDLIAQGNPTAALPWLENLEQEYDTLSAYVLYQRARAYEAAGDRTEAQAAWQALLRQSAQDPIAAEALYALGLAEPSASYWEDLLTQFPAHPRSVTVAQTRLASQPNQVNLLLILARHGLYLPDITSVLDRLVDNYSSQLTPDDWEAIGFGYWEKQRYNRAGLAYANAPATDLNRYRAARGADIGNRTGDAIRAYQQLAQEFPDSPDTAQGLIHLARLTDNNPEAIAYLDQVIERFPDRAADALIARADRLDAIQSPQSAVQDRQSVLSQYSASDAAGDLRWQQVERRYANGDIEGAWEWARQLVQENPEHDHAAEAAFWVGKWASQLGRPQDAQDAFEYVLSQYPDSYYAWRSAVLLGWEIGDFNTVRQQTPEVVDSLQTLSLPAGSEILQELYLIGQFQDAWSRWQVEFANPQHPTVAEQFTDGLVRLGVGDHLEGIFMIESLAWRDDPGDRAAYEELRQYKTYWEALYPFPFQDPIEQWSQQRQLNPLLVTALIRQESRFQPKIRSSAGAVGLMQVLPETAEWIASQSDVGEYTIDDPNDNIELGTWYLDYTHREYRGNSMLAVASYNAGPGNVADWVVEFGTSDPDEFVEHIPFSETKYYVESVFGNYWNYLRLYNPDLSQRLAEHSPEHAQLVAQDQSP